jgi:hypothetical protein
VNRAGRAALAALVGAYLLSAWPSRLSAVDDAYVSMRYAANLANGHGLTYNAGLPPVEGYSDFLWVLLLVPATWLRLHPATWMTGLGLVFGAGSVIAIARLARALAPGWSWLPIAAFWAVSPQVAVASTNGLETSLWLTALFLAFELRSRESAWAGPVAAILPLVRPEGLAVAGLLAMGSLRRVGWVAACVAPYLAWKLWYFGGVLPNTFAAQARQPLWEMWELNRAYFARTPTFWAFATLFAVGALGARSWLPLAGALGLGVVAFRVYNWMPGGRLLLGSVGLALAGCAPLLTRWRSLPLVAAGAWFALGPSRHEEVRYDANNTVLPGNGGERMGRWIAARAPERAQLLVRDAGVVAYFAGLDVVAVDIHPYSLTDPTLTGKPFPFARFDHPDFLVTTAMTEEELPTSYGLERRLLARLGAGVVAVLDEKQHHRRYYRLWVSRDAIVGD